MRGTGRYNLAQGAIATVSLPKIIRAGADAAMGYLRAGMIDLLKLLGGFLVGLFRSQAAREAEMAFLRQQLLVLKRRAGTRRSRLASRSCVRCRSRQQPVQVEQSQRREPDPAD